MFKKIKDSFIKQFRLAFLKRKHFFGSYADNQIAMRKWFVDGKYIVCLIQDSNFKFTPTVSDSNMAMMALVKEQARQYSRKLRKQHRCTVWYVEDHYLTRLLGWRPGKENLMLRN